MGLCVIGRSAYAADDQKAAQEVLKKIQASAQNLNYSGTFVYQQASQIRTSKITHL
jgi:sigma-E factor negative regulatory protein RseB